MYSDFGDDVYIPLNKRLCRFVEETGDRELGDIDKSNQMKIFTFIDGTVPCDICKETIDTINEWITKNKFMYYDVITWVIEPEMKENIMCKEIGIVQSPTTFFCDKHGNIHDIVTGRPSMAWLDKYILPMMET